MAGRTIEGKTIKGSVWEQADVCVIGSGAGGAVVAKELAEKGLKVVVLEEGGNYGSKDFPRSILDSFNKLYRNQGLDTTLGVPAIVLPTGKCLGGTTVINMGTCFRLPEYTHKKWDDLGIKGYSAKDLAPYYDQVEKIMNVGPVSPEVMGRNGEIIAEGANKLGLHPTPILRNVNERCKGCCNCSYGCREDAKGSMILNYLPRAVELGAQIYCDAKAEFIVHDKEKVMGVTGSIRDRESGAFRHFIEVAADVVVVCAGALNSPLLLLKSEICNSSGQVGKNLKLHLCGRAIGVFDQFIDGHHGVGQSLYIDDYSELGIMLEATFTGPASEFPGLNGFGKEFWDHLKEYRRLASIGVMVSDTSIGKVSVGLDSEPMVTYNMNQRDAEALKKGMLISARIMFAVGAKQVLTTTSCFPRINNLVEVEKFQDVKVEPGNFLVMAFHPMGTCRMGVDPKKSVVSPDLETWDMKNLYLADASVFPGSLGVNPQETIWAFATRCAENIVKNVRS